MTSELPQELLEEILCRVPATSLKRLRTTCKQWNHLFNDKRFSKKHYDKAPKQLLGLTLTEESRVCLLNVNLHNGIPSAEVTSELSLNQVFVDKVSHCDGLLLCTIKGDDTRIIVWNPCNGQIKWIQTRNNSYSHGFVLGYYQENKSCDKSYKILDYNWYNHEPELYDINSNSWRNLGVIRIPDYNILSFSYCNVSLKGKTYWFAYGSELPEKKFGLISFDFTRERFERLRLPYQCDSYKNLSLSVVGEEKLSVLLQREKTSRGEIWVTNKIDDETKELSWSKLLELNENSGCDRWLVTGFLVDEEKKIVVFCDCIFQAVITTLYIIGEDSNATPTYFPFKNMSSYRPFFIGYVPCLTQFQPPIGKRKGGE